MTLPRTTTATATALLFAFSTAAPALAQQQIAFSDLPQDHRAYAAVEALADQGIVSGYPDGTFRPEQPVSRAEALKLVIASFVKPEELSQATSSPYADVPTDAWFLPYVETARERGLIDGPPAKPQFLGSQTVLKVEFMKMLLLAYSVDPSAYSEIVLPLASDVTDTSAWYYPYLRYSLSASMTMIGEDGLLHPDRELTRGDTALLLYRFLMYREGRRTQALLSETESEIIVILNMLEANDIVQAEYASARALLAARGAHASKSDEPVTQGALKIAEAFRALVRGYRAGVDERYEDTVELAKSAWGLAGRAAEISPKLSEISTQVQSIASKMAESARANMAQE